MTGAVGWGKPLIPYDAWNESCLGFGNPENCPSPSGPDHDFGSGPNLYTVMDDNMGRSRDLLGAGQKSGMYWALDPDTGEVVWGTQVGPSGGV